MRRSTHHRISERWGLLSVGVLLAVLCCAGRALAVADSAVVSVETTDGRSDPVSGVARVFRVSGTSAVSNRVYVKYRPAGGAPCGASADNDPGALSANDPLYVYGDSVSGPFNLQRAGTWSRGAGTFLFCTWIASSSSSSATPFSQTLAFRAPSGTITTTLNPSSPTVDQQATVTVTGSSESPAYVYATVRPGGETACAPTYAADTGTPLLNGQAVYGSFSVATTTKQTTAGSYLICVWLSKSPSDPAPIAGPQPRAYEVVAVVIPAPLPPRIDRIGAVVSLRRRHRHYSGRLTTYARCRQRRTVVLRRVGSRTRSFGSTRTRRSGTFTFHRKRRLRGSVYAVAIPRTQGQTICTGARSGRIRG